MKSFIAYGLGFAALCSVGTLVQGVDKQIHPQVPPPGLDAHESSAGSSVLGQFRTSVSSWLWLRTDLYLHNGVQMRQMTDSEKKQGIATSKAHEDGHESIVNEDAVTTVIPPAERDFRGPLGDIERAVSSYQDMHEHHHNDPKVALPLFRLMTWIDPQFISGWTTGAMVMARDNNEESYRKSFAFLKEGLKENPESVALLSDMGRVSAVHFHDLNTAIKLLNEACKLGSSHFDSLADIEKEGLNQAFRWLSICLRDVGDEANRVKLLQVGIRFFPDDLFLQMALNPPPSILTKEGQVEWINEQMKSR